MPRCRLALLVIILGIGFLGGLSHARASTVANQATLSYIFEGSARDVQSNRVSFDTAFARTKSQTAFLRELPGGGGAQVPQQVGQCRLANGEIGQSVGPQTSTAALGATSLEPAVSYRPGDIVYVSVTDADQNRDAAVQDSVEATLTTSLGDREVMLLQETGPNTGIFEGSLPTHGDPPATPNDCRLLIKSGSRIEVSYVDVGDDGDSSSAALLVDPFGVVFDSATGAPVDGAEVTLIDAATGQPAKVYGDDGQSDYPSTVTSGTATTDSSGSGYAAIAGGYRFPFVTPGTYRVVVSPPDPYSAPSSASREALAQLVSPAGTPFAIDDGSFALPFALAAPQPLRLDIPVDRAARSFTLEKLASTAQAESGDFVHYRLRAHNLASGPVRDFTIVDDLPAGFRFRPGSVRIAGAPAPDPAVSDDGRRLVFSLAEAPAKGTLEVGYTLVVGPEARPGDAVNRATAWLGTLALSNEAGASVRVRPPFLTDAATIIGRISVGQCNASARDRPGVAGVRLLLEDGTYVVSDTDGRYHFEGVEPGLHVVQLDTSSLPEGYEPAGCIQNSRRAGRTFSTFVELSGGSMWRADFVLRKTGAAAAAETSFVPEPVDDATAAGAKTDWLTGQAPGTAILFPARGYNPRSPAQRLIVKHRPDEAVTVTVNGAAASPLARDSDLKDPGGVVVSRWRGLPLVEGRNLLTAEIRSADGKPAQTLSREIWYTNAPARAAIVAEKSHLVADGRTRPVVAVRFTDSSGRPVHGGSTGSFRVAPPYLPAAEVDAQQERQLAGLDRRPTEWHVRGDDGIAYIELAPTTQTGTMTLGFDFQSERTRYSQELESWLSPGDSDWIMVGYVAGTTGFNTLRDKSKLLDKDQPDSFTDGGASFYAKGRVLGKWLLTLAYDADRKARRPGEARKLLRTIDPDRYYTVYGDGTEQRYDAPTSDRLYLRLEAPQFYALYGDFETGLTRTELTRYSRTLTGVKAEYRGRQLGVTAFAADTGLGFARDEIQGNGLSGPYRLSRRNLVLNSDKVVIEVRDRFRSDAIVRRVPQTRHIDYDIDALSGTIRFRAPIASRDADLNPQFIVVDYETEGTAQQYLNAGGRASMRLADGKVEAGASYLRDADNSGRTDIGGLDMRIRPRADTEVRLEAAHSDRHAATPASGDAYIAEVEHHGARFDLLGYFRQQDSSFGVGQQNAAESGTRKYGVDGSLRLADKLKLTGSAYRQENLAGPGRRDALDLRGDYKDGPLGLRAGFRYVDDRNQNGDQRLSELLTLGASHEFLDRKLVLDADAEIALAGHNDSADFPSRYRLGARYAITDDIRVLASHEIADGEAFDAETTELGFEVVPWRGSKLSTTLNQRAMSEFGPRTFAALGLTQSLLLGDKWGLDVSFDSNATLKGAIPPEDVLRREQPVASGGFLGQSLTEDFWALSIGATYRTDTLSWTGRAEYRQGDFGDRSGFTTAVFRQTQDGIALAASAQLFRVRQTDPISGDATDGTSGLLRLSGAWRPEWSNWSVLDRLDFSLEDLSAGTLPGPFGSAPGTGGKSRRVVNNLVANFTSDDEAFQASIYWGAKYVLDRYESEDFGGFAQVLGVDIRRNAGARVDVGVSASVHHVAEGGRLAYSLGPNVGTTPFKNAWISVGYNVAGYHDRDFEDSRYTRKGAYVSFRLKLDQMTPEGIFGHIAR